MEKLDLKNLSVRDKMIMVFTLTAALGYGYFEFEYKPVQAKIKNIKVELADAKTIGNSFRQAVMNAGSLEKTLREIEGLEEKIKGMKNEIDGIKSKMEGKHVEILFELQRRAEHHGVVIKTLRTAEKTLARGNMRFLELSLILEMQSDYQSLKNFIASLQRFSAILWIQSLSTKRNAAILPEIEIQLHLKVISL
ncbi:MAG: hypothetical protein V3U37_02350 [Nitrospinaceae bacterium]